MRHRWLQLVIFAASVVFAFFLLTTLQADQRNVRLSFADLVPSTMPQAQKAMALYDAVGTSDVLLSFEDVDVPSQQKQMLELHAELAATDSLAQGTLPPYLT